MLTMPSLVGLTMPQWVTLVITLLTPVVLMEAWLGHFRSGFPARVQYVPFVVGTVLATAGFAGTVAPRASWVHGGLRLAGALAIATGFVGAGYHHWFGITRRVGGYRFMLHHLMYGAPPLAPLALAILGALALGSSYALSGVETVGGVSIWRALLLIAVVGLAGAIAQSGLLHYRGSFNTPPMYAPLIIPPLAVAAGVWMAAAPGPIAQLASRIALGLTFLTGFIGLGMHLRGLDRQMGGLHVPLFNLLQGPPPVAPVIFSGLAAVGLAAIEMAR